jgi:hypothetical protein
VTCTRDPGPWGLTGEFSGALKLPVVIEMPAFLLSLHYLGSEFRGICSKHFIVYGHEFYLILGRW